MREQGCRSHPSAKGAVDALKGTGPLSLSQRYRERGRPGRPGLRVQGRWVHQGVREGPAVGPERTG
eukprot:355511-Chlamydomonas_euryale.AAC.2